MARNLLIIITYIGAYILTMIFAITLFTSAPHIPEIQVGVWAQIGLGVIPFVMMLVFFRRYIWDQTRKFLREPVKIIIYGVLGYAAILFVSIIISAIFMELGLTGTSENQEGIESLFTSITQLDLILLSSVIVFFTPIVEEITFRKGIYGLVGYIYMYIAVRVKPNVNHKKGSTSYKIASIIAIIISGFLFGLLHVSNGDWISIIPYGATGIVLGIVYYISGRNIYTPIIAHIINNVIGLIVILTM